MVDKKLSEVNEFEEKLGDLGKIDVLVIGTLRHFIIPYRRDDKKLSEVNDICVEIFIDVFWLKD